MAAILELTRVFRMGGRDMVDPDPTMRPEEVLKHYGRQNPKLLGAKIIEPVVEGDRHVYEIRQVNFGDRG